MRALAPISTAWSRPDQLYSLLGVGWTSDHCTGTRSEPIRAARMEDVSVSVSRVCGAMAKKRGGGGARALPVGASALATGRAIAAASVAIEASRKIVFFLALIGAGKLATQ